MLEHLDPQARDLRRVVLLGAGGFVSAHLQDLLAQQAIPFLSLSSRDVDLTRHESADRLSAALEDGDTIVMTSAITPDKGGGFEVFMKNLRMAETVCSALRRAACHHFIYLSSDAVYDAHKTPLDEDSSREPVDLYAAMHTSREMMLQSVAGQLRIPLCVLRPTNIYGEGDTHNSYGPNRFIRTALAERRITLFGKGEERRNHLYIGDAVELILRVVRHRSTGTLNLAANRSWSFLRVAQTIQELLPFEVELSFRPRQLPTVHKPYKPTQAFRFLYNLGRRIGPVVHRPYYIGALRRSFPGFASTDLRTGLAETIERARNSKKEVPA